MNVDGWNYPCPERVPTVLKKALVLPCFGGPTGVEVRRASLQPAAMSARTEHRKLVFRWVTWIGGQNRNMDMVDAAEKCGVSCCRPRKYPYPAPAAGVYTSLELLSWYTA